MRRNFGNNSQIYACGFSLGSNHLLRHLATHENCSEICGIKAAMSVSSAFCCLTAGVQLKSQTMGIYDYYIKRKVSAPFFEKRYKVQSEDNKFLLSKEAEDSVSLLHFD